MPGVTFHPLSLDTDQFTLRHLTYFQVKRQLDGSPVILNCAPQQVTETNEHHVSTGTSFLQHVSELSSIKIKMIVFIVPEYSDH